MTRKLQLWLVIALCTLVTNSGVATGAEPEAIYRGTWEVERFDVSPPLRDIKPLAIEPGMPYGGLMIDPDSGYEGPMGPQDFDFIVQRFAGTGEIPSPLLSFDGPPNLFGGAPPDPVGDVGPNHYVAMSNLYFQIYDKTGTSLFGPAANNTLWAGFGGACQTSNDGDPIVLHDQIADRWIMTQFALGATNYNCVAVSTTSDPLGTYYRWAFSTGSNMPDYPKYGVWPDALYISTREFNGPFVGVGAYAVNRAQLVAGNPAPTVISFLVPPGGAPYNVGDGLLPSDMDGVIPPPAGSPNYFLGAMDDGGQYGAPQDALNLWKFHADFATPANSTFVLTNTIPIAAYDTQYPCSPGSRDCIPQPSTGTKLDILSYRQRPMHRLAYRNFGDHEALVTNQSVEAAPSLAGIRWWEIRDPNGTPVIHQEGTYAPGVSDGIHRWMGSIAMDSAGNMALGYSASDATTTFPSVWYTGRLAGDPPGIMGQGEASFVNGTGSQTGFTRWGDYTSMNVDPVDDCTFWYVNEYVPTTSSSGWRLRIGAFKFNACGTPDFYLGGSPNPVDICTGSDAVYNITVGQVAGFTNQVTLSAIGNPAGTSKNFAPNPVTPPGASTFTIGNTGSAAAGSYVVTVSGSASGSPGHSIPLDLNVFSSAPNTPALTLPVNGAPNQPVRPDFQWSAVNQGAVYTLEVATDTAFTNVVYTTTVPGTTATPTTDLNTNTEYFWRVMAANACGAGPWSAVWSFTTIAVAGDCGIGTVADVHWSDDFESGAPGWTTGGTSSTWALGAGVSPSGPHSGASVYHGNDSGSVSDQQLVSPAVALPSGPGHTAINLQFWNYQEMEDGGSACYDGGLLEITTDGGSSWTQLPTGVMQTDPYDGPIDGGFSNPLAGLDAWCGDPQDWLRSVVDLDAYAGETVQFRFRLGTDSSVSHPGWDIDDVWVQSCVPDDPGLIFTDGFESGDTTLWSNTVPAP
jgi:hypothetical protein